jgi:ubiquinone/menaquinone biosynthesis C-methylase UbiE
MTVRKAAVVEQYVTEQEYPTYFGTLNGLREQIASDLPLKSGTTILDLACGYGFFTVALARRHPHVSIVGIDLTETNVANATVRVARHQLSDRVRIVQMDSTQMAFADGSFDLVANFLGLEDVHMTRGKTGVEQTFKEVSRVLTGGGDFCFAAMPSEEAETEAQRLEIEVFSYTCNCTWLSVAQYYEMLKRAGFSLIEKKAYRTGKRLTSQQAIEEIRFACDKAPEIYGIHTPPFEDVWAKFGPDIEKHGLGHYSRVAAFFSRKIT